MRPFRVRDGVKSSKSPRGSCGIRFPPPPPPGTSSLLFCSQDKAEDRCGNDADKTKTRTPLTAWLQLLRCLHAGFNTDSTRAK